MRNTTRLFKALSDGNRLRILKMLEVRPLCVCEITRILQLAPSTVSKHLSILRDAGFILDEKNGKWVTYHLNIQSKDPRVAQLLSLLRTWNLQSEQVEHDLQFLQSIQGINLCHLQEE